MKKTIICTLLGILVISCKTIKDEDHFFGSINQINKDYETVELRGDSVSVDGITFRVFAVHDSLILFWNNNMPESMTFSISDMRTGKHYGNYIPQGRGPHESETAPIYQFYNKGNDLTTLLRAYNEDELREWNISRTLATGHTVYDTIFPYKWRMETPSASLGVFRMDEDKIFEKMPGRYSESGDETLEWPRFVVRSLRENKIVREYDVYKNNVQTINPQQFALSPFYSSDCLKPDGTKIAIGMRYLDQINILDLESGEVSYHRAANSPSLSIFEDEIDEIRYKNVLRFHYQCQCDDNYIYSLYIGHTSYDEFEKPFHPNKVRQYDWNGRLIREMTLSEPATQIWLDTANNILYTFSEINEHIWRYDLNELDS
jgi:hypothetical protein